MKAGSRIPVFERTLVERIEEEKESSNLPVTEQSAEILCEECGRPFVVTELI